MSATILLAGGGTGGHVFPMIAVADALRAIEPSIGVVFVGTERGIETRVVPERGYTLELMRVLPIRGGGLGGMLRGVSRAFGSIPEARALVRKLAPSAVFSIGGYAAGPVSLAARTRGVPLALMEPNAVIGLANRLIAPIVQRAYTAFPEPERHFGAKKVLRSGVPIRAGFDARPYARGAGPLRVLVLGGSQGAKALNEAVPDALSHLKTAVTVVHQCGRAHFDAVRERYAGRAEVVAFIDDMPAAIAAADLVVGRSGASAVAEVCAVGRPSVLVPYPFAAGNHQLRNAESLAAAGAAVCVPARDATPERIAAEIDRLAAERDALEHMAAAARAVGRPQAAHTVACDLLALAGLAAESGASVAANTETPDNGPLALSGAS